MRPIATPDEIFQELFQDVQESRIFADSKTFVDAIPAREPSRILEEFRQRRLLREFHLETYISENFTPPASTDQQLHALDRQPVREYIERMWDVLTRKPDQVQKNSSLMALPHPYIVPGGRFREIYYWDSYFTMLGLAASGRLELLRHMVENFTWLIEQLGFIPNGNRSYYCTRSQPPFFALMVELLAELEEAHRPGSGEETYRRYRPALQREYEFWMADKGNSGTSRRVVQVGDTALNRYWDDSDLPRQESHAEDIETANTSEQSASAVYREIRAGAESGWDYSSRWLADGHHMNTICTTSVVPVDLNCLMFKLESVLAKAYRADGLTAQEKHFNDLAMIRKHAVQTHFFDERRQYFTDLLLPDLAYSQRYSLAAAYPLFFGIATDTQAAAVATVLQQDFLKAGGWVTTLATTGEQWDAPNGWAPLQWIVYRGLKNYGFTDQAIIGARRWVDNNVAVYEKAGVLVEKYNVEDTQLMAGGGEYDVQDGFGWTNGVLLCLMDELAQ